MAANVGIGGAVGAAVGACAIPILGPGAVPLMISLAGAGAGIGWKASQAEIARKAAEKGMKILDKRSEGCLRIFEQGATAVGRSVERMANTWNRFAIAGAVAAASIGVHYLANATADKECHNNPLIFICLHNTGVNIATTLTTVATTFAIGAKACSLVMNVNSPLAAAEEDSSDVQSPPSKQAASDYVWPGYINVRGPDGRYVPVERSHPIETDHEDRIRDYDRRDEVSVPERPVCSLKKNNVSYRAVYGFDYSKYGLIKIGGIWIDPKNEQDIDVVNYRIRSASSSCCVS